jgi:hypothetical protein
MPGGWKNVLGERWVGSPRLGLSARAEIDLVSSLIEDRLFVTAPARPAPAGDRLYFHNVAMQFGGEWAKGISFSNYHAGSVFFDGTNVLAASAIQDEANGYRHFPQINKIDSGGTILSSGYVIHNVLQNYLFTTDVQVASGAAGYVFCAASSNESSDVAAPVLFALSSDLSTLLWSGTAPGTSDDRIFDVRPAMDGDSAYFAGTKYTQSSRLIGVCHQIDYTGAIARSWYMDSVAGGVHTRFFASVPDNDGSMYMFGHTENGATEGSLIVKFDASHAVLWKKCFGGGSGKSFGFVVSTGTIYHAQPSAIGTTILSKISGAGNVISQLEVYSGSMSIRPIGFIHDGADGAYLLVSAIDAGNSDTLVLMRLDSSYSVLWQIDIAPALTGGYPSWYSGGLSFDGDFVYAAMPSGKLLLKVSADGIASGFTIGGGGLFEAVLSTANLQTQATSTTVTAITYSAASGSFYSMTAAPSGFAIRSSGFTPAPEDLSGFVLTGPPRLAQVDGARFVGGFSVATPSIYGMDRAPGFSQVDRSFASIASAPGRQGVLLGVYVSPPFNAGQWVGDGDAALYIADSVSNAALDFTAGAPEVYIWRPSTYSRVGTLHSAAGERYGTPSTTEKVTAARFRPCPIFALAGDVIVVELWGQVLSTGIPSYTGHAYIDGTTLNDTDNAAVSNYAANIRFSETLTFNIATQTYEVAITESATAGSSQSGAANIDCARIEATAVDSAVDGARLSYADMAAPAAADGAVVSALETSAQHTESAPASIAQDGGPVFSGASTEPATSISEQDFSSGVFAVHDAPTSADSSGESIALFVADHASPAASTESAQANAVVVANIAASATLAMTQDAGLSWAAEGVGVGAGSMATDAEYQKGGSASEAAPAQASLSCTAAMTVQGTDGDGDPLMHLVSLLIHADPVNGGTRPVDVIGNTMLFQGDDLGNNFEVAASPYFSTNQSKFGGYSLFFQIFGAAMPVVKSDLLTLNGDFTIEGWAMPADVGGNTEVLFSFGNASLATYSTHTLPGRFTVIDGAGNETTHQNSFATGVFKHWAVVRKDGYITTFLDGVKSQYTPLHMPGQIVPGYTLGGPVFMSIGGGGLSGDGNPFYGYMDEIRISRTARYVDSFSVQTKPFSDHGYTGIKADAESSWGNSVSADIPESASATDAYVVTKFKYAVSIAESSTPTVSADSAIVALGAIHQELASAVAIQDCAYSGFVDVHESSAVADLAAAGFNLIAAFDSVAEASDSTDNRSSTGIAIVEQAFSATVAGVSVQFVVSTRQEAGAGFSTVTTLDMTAAAEELAAALSIAASELLGDSGKEISVIYALQKAASAAVLSPRHSIFVMTKSDGIQVKVKP